MDKDQNRFGYIKDQIPAQRYGAIMAYIYRKPKPDQLSPKGDESRENTPRLKKMDTKGNKRSTEELSPPG